MNEAESKSAKASLLDRVAQNVFDYVEMVAWAVLAVLLIFMFGIRLCRVDGQSMENTLHDAENLLLYSAAYTPKQDDVVVFHLTRGLESQQKTYVKRVIAVGGQTVEIDTKTNVIKVDGVVYEDSHSVLKNLSDEEIGRYYTALFGYGFNHVTGVFTTTVPENHVFVLGDNRNNSKDSRNPDIGFVDARCILGKVIFRLAPLTVFS